jgi:hypothetical protein
VPGNQQFAGATASLSVPEARPYGSAMEAPSAIPALLADQFLVDSGAR